MARNIYLRNIDEKLFAQLKTMASNKDISMNNLILKLLKKGLRSIQVRFSKTYHDLDKLAGTWTKQEAKTFLKSIASLERVDKDLWK